MVMDKQTNGGVFTDTNVMQAPLSANSTQVQNTMMNLANLNRYKILKDKTVRMDNILSWNDASGSGTYAAGNKLVKFNLRFKRPIRVEFNSVNGGTYLDIVTDPSI